MRCSEVYGRADSMEKQVSEIQGSGGAYEWTYESSFFGCMRDGVDGRADLGLG
jgi:hypothetical protein